MGLPKRLAVGPMAGWYGSQYLRNIRELGKSPTANIKQVSKQASKQARLT